MSDFKAKINSISISAGAPAAPDPAGRSLQGTPDPLAGIKGAYF